MVIWELKPSTFESYEGLYRNYIEPDDISTQPIKDIKSINIQNFYDRLMKLKLKHTEKPMTPYRVKAIHKLLHLFFVYFVCFVYFILFILLFF